MKSVYLLYDSSRGFFYHLKNDVDALFFYNKNLNYLRKNFRYVYFDRFDHFLTLKEKEIKFKLNNKKDIKNFFRHALSNYDFYFFNQVNYVYFKQIHGYYSIISSISSEFQKLIEKDDKKDERTEKRKFNINLNVFNIQSILYEILNAYMEYQFTNKINKNLYLVKVKFYDDKISRNAKKKHKNLREIYAISFEKIFKTFDNVINDLSEKEKIFFELLSSKDYNILKLFFIVKKEYKIKYIKEKHDFVLCVFDMNDRQIRYDLLKNLKNNQILKTYDVIGYDIQKSNEFIEENLKLYLKINNISDESIKFVKIPFEKLVLFFSNIMLIEDYSDLRVEIKRRRKKLSAFF
ncbi:MAG: hypothetical protein NZZ41_00885 [Candidatus Dojkabacteria bacterium]|nr:hypothetical protein [Candidatus Dojkabacteria bacterium]